MDELLTGRQEVIIAFERGIFSMRHIGAIDDEDDDDNYMNDDVLYSEGQLTPTAPTNPPVILEPPPGRLTQKDGIKILPQKQMRQRLPVLLAQVQPNYKSENREIKLQ